ncbi:MAG: sugar phosphate nucleotidyltransferase [bacterium]|nr:sugar phosphate nucleotidyltransferase [bacterium]
MKDILLYLIDENETIMRALEKLSRTGKQILFTVNKESKATGSITDGDIRRAILRHTKLNESVKKISNKKFIYVTDDSPSLAKRKMEREKVRHVPLLDKSGRIAKIFIHDDFSNDETSSAVLIFAGGMGMRMRPLTLKTPKPLLSIGSSSIIESIIDKFLSDGFKNIFISLNYKSEMIKSKLKEKYKDRLDDSSFIVEKTPLGTAGSMLCLRERGFRDVITHNADIITDIDFRMLLDYHRKSSNKATLVLIEHQMKIEYGLVNIEKKRIASILEKPEISFFALSGVNVFSFQVMKKLRKKRIDMNDFIEKLIKRREKTGWFVHEGLWYDVGSLENYLRAKEVYKNSTLITL